MHSFVEQEAKYDVEPGFAVPDLADVVPAGGRLETTTEQLRSDYFDTADHALFRAHMTLRRRTGTTDTGWQLKVPHPPFREEIHADADADLGSDAVPEELQRLLVGVRGGQPLRQVASITTERAVTRLVDAAGRSLAEIDDDTVHATAAGSSATVSAWREVEVELGEGPVELLRRLDKRLRRAGARRSRSSSKLARALPAEVTDQAASADAANAGKRRLTAGDVVSSYLAEQQLVMLAGDVALRRDDDSAIHKTRVATRRLRSTLRVFAKLVDPARAAALDQELRWYAAQLGEVRDRQVLRARLDTMVDAVDDTLLLGPVKTRIDEELQSETRDRWHRLQEDLTGERYAGLLADVAQWVRQPPFTDAAARPARTIEKLVRRADDKVAKKLRYANATGDVHLLHSARKSAKRARYAAEAAAPVLGASASSAEAKRYQKLQDLLGKHQDSLVSADWLRRVGAKAGTSEGENGFAFGILHEREERNAAEARRRARKVARRYA